jgi:hypothetical protein
MRLARIPIGLTGLLIDQQFGLLPNAPIYLIALGALVTFAKQHRRLAIELLAIAAPYVIAVAAFHMWWAGLSSPARFLVPVLLPMALPIALYWQRHARQTPRAITLTLLFISAAITGVLTCADDGNLLYNTRDGFAGWLDWVAPAANLAYALPSLFQGSVAAAWGRAAVWGAAFVAGWMLLRAFDRRAGQSPVTVVALVTVASVSLGASMGWMTSDQRATEPGSSEIAMMSAACGQDPTLVRIAPFSMSASRRDDEGFGIRDAARRPMTASAPLWTARGIPPGHYRVLLDSGLDVTGALTIALGKPDAILHQCSFREHRPGATHCFVELPAGATTLWMTADPLMQSSAEAVRLQPIAFETPGTCGLRADRAVITEPGVIYAQRGSVYAESTGLWVMGGRMAQLTVEAGGAPALHIRNGPRRNRVRLTAGEAHDERDLGPGESTTFRLSQEQGGSIIPVTVWSETGFRPADSQPGNRDLRSLGVWVELR